MLSQQTDSLGNVVLVTQEPLFALDHFLHTGFATEKL